MRLGFTLTVFDWLLGLWSLVGLSRDGVEIIPIRQSVFATTSRSSRLIRSLQSRLMETAMLPWSSNYSTWSVVWAWAYLGPRNLPLQVSIDSYNLTRQLGVIRRDFYELIPCLCCHTGQSSRNNHILPIRPCNGSSHIHQAMAR